MVALSPSTAILQAAFPGRVALGPKEIAQALHGPGKDTKKRVEAVRNALDNGTLIPGLRKSGTRWSVPIATLGAALDAQAEARPQPTTVDEDAGPTRRPRRSKHATIGPRMLLAQQRSAQVWGEILLGLEALEAADLAQRLADTLPPADPALPGRLHPFRDPPSSRRDPD